VSARIFMGSAVALLGIGLGAVSGCELVVGDGNYKVGSGSGSSSSSGATVSSGTVSSGTVSSGSASSGAALGPSPECISCEQGSCSGQWTACQANPACVSFEECEANCGTQACTCEHDFPNGAALWLALNTCATSNCVPCPFMGVGDPCMQDGDCTDISTCSLWCTEECMVSSDCAGLDFNGENLFGQNTYCILNGDNVDSCFPGCTTNADCQAFPGTDCETANAVDNPTANISICTLPADAGTN
jgi:hypothetical protein